MDISSVMSGGNLEKQLAKIKEIECAERKAADKKHIIKVSIDPNCYVAEQIAFQEHLIRNLLAQVQTLTVIVEKLSATLSK